MYGDRHPGSGTVYCGPTRQRKDVGPARVRFDRIPRPDDVPPADPLDGLTQLELNKLRLRRRMALGFD